MADPYYTPSHPSDHTSSMTDYTRLDHPLPPDRPNHPSLFSQYSPPIQSHYNHTPYPYPHSLDQLPTSYLHQPFSRPTVNINTSNTSSFWPENNPHALLDEEEQEVTEEIKKLKNHNSKRNTPPNDVKTDAKKRQPPRFFNLFGYRQLMVIGIAALFLIVSAIVIILVTHLKKISQSHGGEPDDSNDITTQSGLGSARNISSDGLDPFNRTDPTYSIPDDGRRGGSNGYDSLIVFGASYCDNAHARPSNLRYSLKPPPYYKGRWTNGYVWDEYLSAIIGPGGRRTTLVNYAFGGATVDNSLNEAPVPDLDQQVNAFLSDLSAQSPGAGPADGKSLIAIWIGINSVTKIWNSVLKQQVQARSQADVQGIMAQAQVNMNSTVDQIFNVVANLIHTNAFKNASPDLMILTIPPVQLLLVNIRAAKGNMGALRTLGMLNEMFNNRFNTQFNQLQSNLLQQPVIDNSQQRLFTLDIQNIWRGFIDQPSSSNLTVVDQPCLTKLGACSQPDSYLFWDTLHPTTHIHKELALIMGDEINR